MVHPLSHLSPAEIDRASSILKSNIALAQGEKYLFKAVTLLEPPKKQVIAYLDAKKASWTPPRVDRIAYIPFYIKSKDTERLLEAYVDLNTGKLIKVVPVPSHFHGNVGASEMHEVSDLVMNDPNVQARLKKIGLPDDWEAVAEPWIMGHDGTVGPEHGYQVYMYARKKGEPDFNHYAHPLAISPMVDAKTLKIYKIMDLPTGADATIKKDQEFLPDLTPNSYLPEDQDLRKDLKPLRVTQPEGASFSLEDGIMKWQGWQFHLSLNYREGAVLHDVSFKGRQVLYRMALSDMAVPYGDPRSPFTRKEAFDLGDLGAGNTANNLALGCDCLGAITYLDLPLTGDDGASRISENVLCIHEQDNGIGWKHTNFRTERAVVTRNRELILQMIITVGNYEYILMYIFNQAGDLSYEVRATGILSTQPIDEGVTVDYGTIVSPKVLAPVHQHIFCLRIDPAIDGHKNSVVMDEIEPMALNSENPHKVGYRVKSQIVKQPGGYDFEWKNNRGFKIINPSVINPVTMKPVSYKLHVPITQHIVADPASLHALRAEFADKHIYVTKYRDGELYCAGKFTNQSPGGAGLKTFVRPNDSIENDDLVLWVNLGLQHVPRPEDFPVMPIEPIRMTMRPTGFFDKNPALDVPPSSQTFNKSTLLRSDGTSASNGCCKI